VIVVEVATTPSAEIFVVGVEYKLTVLVVLAVQPAGLITFTEYVVLTVGLTEIELVVNPLDH
jgi:hypothetical protein